MKLKEKKAVLEELRKTPIIEIACAKAGVSRSAYYKWRKDAKFSAAAEQAIRTGRDFICDIAEGQLLNAIKTGDYKSIALWLKTYRPEYRNKLDVSGNIITQKEVTPEDRAAIERLIKNIPRVLDEETTTDATDSKPDHA